MIVYPANVRENEALKAWLAEKLFDYRPGTGTVCVGVERHKRLCCVVAWDNWTGMDMEVAIAASSPLWATRQTIATLLAYPFLQVKVQRITAKVYKSNKRSRRFVEGLGFKHEGTHRHAGINLETIFSYGLTKADYIERYVKRNLNVEEKPAITAARA